MRTPPPGAASTEVWRDFNEWADSHHLGLALEDWEPWWECYFDAFAKGVAVGLEDGRNG